MNDRTGKKMILHGKKINRKYGIKFLSHELKSFFEYLSRYNDKIKGLY